MRQIVKFLLPALSASALLAACGSSSNTTSSSTASSAATAAAKAALVTTATNAALHRTILVDAQGMTLYHLSGEGAGKWICTSSACVGVWHPLVAPSGGLSGGTVGSLGTTMRPDGTTQVTYQGMPLYTFAPDTSPGDVKGQDVKDVGTWTAVTIGAATAATSSSSSSSAPAAAGGGGYGGY
jgi:predicted lipoprotein with Yx(FWY)xxD motif